ncbi:MFS general substrate transporter [Periconia macrospinosa]|uniref:MFS general substrate transporter n=1 Tax=Periconia macrospinosa TaxID=97972 RepID=A0A2V1D9G3_9PLEO|nr:MFS general substrate transporter [Periconia macrospinosa]
MTAPIPPSTSLTGTTKSKDDEAIQNRITPIGTIQDGDIEKFLVMDKVDKFGAHAKTDPREIKLVKKLDWYIMPILWFMYTFNYLDRNAIVNARLNNLEENLGLKNTEYNTCVSILFVGYTFRPSLFMAGFCLAWSIISLLSFLATNYPSMVILRFVLGIVEAPFYPGALYIISLFYTRKEIATRLAILTTGNNFSGSFAGLIAAGIFEGLDKKHGLAGWQWLFIIQGALSAATALLAFWFLPDYPLTTRWLTEEERQLAHNRIFIDTTDVKEGTNVWTGLRDAVADWRTWAFCLMYNLHISSVGFQNFLPTVMGTLGYSRTVTLALTCPPFILAAIVGLIIAWTSGHWNERTWHIVICKSIVLIGFIIPAATNNFAARLLSIFLFVGFSFGINNIVLSWVSSTLGQTNEKRSVALALCNMLGGLANIYTPYLWPSSDSPRYLTAWGASIGFAVGVILITLPLKYALKAQNKRMKRDNPEVMNLYVY